MKKLLVTLILCNFAFGIAQSNDKSIPSETGINEVDEDIPFSVVEEVPVFPGCENVEKNNLMQCFNEKMLRHIRINFNYPEEAIDENIQGRVNVSFVINKEGNVSNIKVYKKPNLEIIEKEALRIIQLLPKMKPAIQRGKNVNVQYIIPINFKLEDPEPKMEEIKE